MVVLIRIDSNAIPPPLEAVGSRGGIFLLVELCLNFIELVYKFHLCCSLVSLVVTSMFLPYVLGCKLYDKYFDVASNF